MGEGYHLYVGSYLLDNGRVFNLDCYLCCFTERDLDGVTPSRIYGYLPHPKPTPEDWAGGFNNAEGIPSYCLTSRVEHVKARLDILGFTLPAAKVAFVEALEETKVTWHALVQGYEGDIPESWCDRHRWLSQVDGLSAFEDWTYGGEVPHRVALRELADEEIGLPHGAVMNPLLVLRAVLERCGLDDGVCLDLTDFADDEYFDEIRILDGMRIHEPTIVLTEGSVDSRILAESQRLLFPFLDGCLSFVDYEVASAPGGVNEQVRFIRMFIGCSISNRILVLFDNDTIGRDAMRRCMDVAKSDSVFLMCLPDLPWLESYPTIGPEGKGRSNVNGAAGSLEMYLGTNALIGEDGEHFPVRWKGFIEGIDSYQGEVSCKRQIQQRYFDFLRSRRQGAERDANWDLSGVNTIFAHLIQALGAR